MHQNFKTISIPKLLCRNLNLNFIFYKFKTNGPAKVNNWEDAEDEKNPMDGQSINLHIEEESFFT